MKKKKRRYRKGWKEDKLTEVPQSERDVFAWDKASVLI